MDNIAKVLIIAAEQSITSKPVFTDELAELAREVLVDFNKSDQGKFMFLQDYAFYGDKLKAMKKYLNEHTS